MTDEQRVIELLRAANPVPHHREAIRVVRETDPLWQTIRTRLTDVTSGGEGSPDAFEVIRHTDGGRDMGNVTPMKSRRIWRGATAAVAAAALVLVAVVVLRPGSDGPPGYVGAEQLDQLPAYVTTPEEIGTVVDAAYASVRLADGPPAVAPNDCTAIGMTDEVESHGYVAFTAPDGFVRSEVTRFADQGATAGLFDRIRQDVQDCDRAEHPLFRADFEAVTEVDAGDRAFVLSVISDDGDRQCWSWVQDGDRLAVTAIAIAPGPSLEQCTAVARLTAEHLGRG